MISQEKRSEISCLLLILFITVIPRLLHGKKKKKVILGRGCRMFLQQWRTICHWITGRSIFLLVLSQLQNRAFIFVRIIEPKLIAKNKLNQACRRGAYERDILISTQYLMHSRTCRIPRGTVQETVWGCWSLCYNCKDISGNVVPNRTCNDPLMTYLWWRHSSSGRTKLSRY